MKYGIARLIQIESSIVKSKMSGTERLRNMMSSTRPIATTEAMSTRSESSFTMSDIS